MAGAAHKQEGGGLPIAVIGAGFSGTMTALHLLREVDCPILLCERGQSFARGAAYSTHDRVHLLNVRAANMSAFPDEPEHFSKWLEAGEHAPSELHETSVGTFVSRGVYGRYLSELLAGAVSGRDGAVRLRIVPDEVVDLEPADTGYNLVLAGGRKHHVSGAVLAVGNLLPNETEPGRYVENPWAVSFADGLVPDEPVVVIGTGLTMVDIVTQLWASGFGGPVVAVSRRGLLPHTHVLTAPWPTPNFIAAELRSPVSLLRRIRQEISVARKEGVTWQSVIDGLRPITSQIWRGLPAAGQRAFLRHLRPWWDVHRHRMAPPIGQQILGLIDQGYLQLRSGRILSVEAGSEHATVSYKARHCDETISLRAQKVINATGSVPASRVNDTLVSRLLARDLIRLDRNRLGVDVTERFAALRADGETTPTLWALGPIVRGVLWECTAVPDIRRHAIDLAEQVKTELTGGGLSLRADQPRER
jgi:uncharacterized NAD(P)/FAD-binding protein YdhS